jgi:hypothetical protein
MRPRTVRVALALAVSGVACRQLVGITDEPPRAATDTVAAGDAGGGRDGAEEQAPDGGGPLVVPQLASTQVPHAPG